MVRSSQSSASMVPRRQLKRHLQPHIHFTRPCFPSLNGWQALLDFSKREAFFVCWLSGFLMRIRLDSREPKTR